MIDFEQLKTKLKPEDSMKLELALNKLKTITPESRSQILEAMSVMIECDELRESNKSANVVHEVKNLRVDNNYLNKKLACKYDELKTLSKLSINIDSDEKALMALAKVLNVGTYCEGAEAIDILIKINLIKMLMSPNTFLDKVIKEIN
jgi:hypothetical protein